jgi:hypothetical protein
MPLDEVINCHRSKITVPISESRIMCEEIVMKTSNDRFLVLAICLLTFY